MSGLTDFVQDCFSGFTVVVTTTFSRSANAIVCVLSCCFLLGRGGLSGLTDVVSCGFSGFTDVVILGGISVVQRWFLWFY